MKVSKLTAIVFSTLALSFSEPNKNIQPTAHSTINQNLIIGNQNEKKT